MNRWCPIALAVLAIALPATAYLPPASAILKHVAQRRGELSLHAMEVRGTISFAGEAARKASSATGLPLSKEELSAPAVLLLKLPERCRLELRPEGAAATSRPAVWERGTRESGQRALETIDGARALVQGLCTLLGERGGNGPSAERALAHALSARGVSLGDVALGRMSGRVAWVLGGRPQETRPQAWVDKQSLQFLRLLATLANGPRDVRLLEFGSPAGGDIFPRTVEVWSKGELEVRFTTEQVTPNPRLSDVLF